MNVAQLKERIFKGTNHQYQDQFHMVDLLNEALNRMTNDAKLEANANIAIVKDTANYSLPANYKSPRALVEGTLDNPTQIYDLVPIDEMAIGYAIWNNEIVMKPTPGESKTLNFYYYKWPAPLLNDEDIPEIDERYHSALTSYAIGMILSLIGGTQGIIQQHFSMWNDALNSFRSDIAKRSKQATVRKVQTWR